MASSLFDFKSAGSTQITMVVGASAFTQIVPIKNQCGVAFQQVGISGNIEIAGGGVSYAPAGATFSGINSNGSSIGLKANGLGFPICQQAGIFPSSGYFPGAPYLWLSAGNSCVLNVLYFFNDAFGNQ